MRRRNLMGMSLVVVAALGALVAGAAAPAAEHKDRDRSISVSFDDYVPLTDCSQVKITFGSGETVRGEEQITIPLAQSAQLIARASTNGGVYVQGADRSDYLVKACKAAGADSLAEAQRILGRLRLGRDGNVVTPRGPADDHDWVVYLLIQAPRNASLDLEAHNGGIGLRDFSGKATVHVENGPLSLHSTTGEVRADTQNGPISVKGDSGNLYLRAQNGPISVELTGTQWQGSLDVHGTNGPLELDLPEGYRSGVRVESRGYSPFSCSAAACAGARKDWDDRNRSVEFGSAPLVVRLSTVNGPVSIGSRRSKASL